MKPFYSADRRSRSLGSPRDRSPTDDNCWVTVHQPRAVPVSRMAFVLAFEGRDGGPENGCECSPRLRRARSRPNAVRTSGAAGSTHEKRTSGFDRIRAAHEFARRKRTGQLGFGPKEDVPGRSRRSLPGMRLPGLKSSRQHVHTSHELFTVGSGVNSDLNYLKPVSLTSLESVRLP